MGRHGLQPILDYTTISSYQTGLGAPLPIISPKDHTSYCHRSFYVRRTWPSSNIVNTGGGPKQAYFYRNDVLKTIIRGCDISIMCQVNLFFLLLFDGGRNFVHRFIHRELLLPTLFFIQVWLKWNIIMYLLYKNKRELIASVLDVHLPYTKNCFDL